MLDTLPPDILLNITNELKYSDIINLLKVNKTFNKFIDDNKKYININHMCYIRWSVENHCKYIEKLTNKFPNVLIYYSQYNESVFNKYIKNIYYLNLNNNTITDDNLLYQHNGCNFLYNAQRLYLLDLSRSSITDKFFMNCSLNKIQNLEVLYLRCCNKITNLAIEHIALSNLCNLKTLDLSCTNISNINNIGKIKNLKKLSLCNTKINDSSLNCSSLKNLQLVELDLSGTNITNISVLSKMYSLEELNLWSTKVTDNTLMCLGNLCNLRILVLNDCRNITNNFLKSNILSKCGSLHYLALKNTNITNYSNLINIRNLRSLEVPEDILYTNIKDKYSFPKLSKSVKISFK